MKVTFVTIGVARHYELAQRTATQWANKLNLDNVTILTEDHINHFNVHPELGEDWMWRSCLLKFWIPLIVDSDVWIHFDADTNVINKFDPSIFYNDFCLIHDRLWWSCVQIWSQRYGIRQYGNAGIFAFNRSHLPLLQQMREFDDYRSFEAYDQSILNVIAQQAGIKWFPRAFNHNNDLPLDAQPWLVNPFILHSFSVYIPEYISQVNQLAEQRQDWLCDYDSMLKMAGTYSLCVKGQNYNVILTNDGVISPLNMLWCARMDGTVAVQTPVFNGPWGEVFVLKQKTNRIFGDEVGCARLTKI